MAISVEWERKSDILIGLTKGRIDSSNAGEFQHLVASGIADGEPALILDLEYLSHISSAGLRVILVIAKKFQNTDRRFAICTLSDSVREVMSVSGLDQVISVCDSQSMALNLLGNS